MLKMDPRVLHAHAKEALCPVLQLSGATLIPRYPYGLLGLLDGVMDQLKQPSLNCLLLLTFHVSWISS